MMIIDDCVQHFVLHSLISRGYYQAHGCFVGETVYCWYGQRCHSLCHCVCLCVQIILLHKIACSVYVLCTCVAHVLHMCYEQRFGAQQFVLQDSYFELLRVRRKFLKTTFKFGGCTLLIAVMLQSVFIVEMHWEQSLASYPYHIPYHQKLTHKQSYV